MRDITEQTAFSKRLSRLWIASQLSRSLSH